MRKTNDSFVYHVRQASPGPSMSLSAQFARPEVSRQPVRPLVSHAKPHKSRTKKVKARLDASRAPPGSSRTPIEPHASTALVPLILSLGSNVWTVIQCSDQTLRAASLAKRARARTQTAPRASHARALSTASRVNAKTVQSRVSWARTTRRVRRALQARSRTTIEPHASTARGRHTLSLECSVSDVMTLSDQTLRAASPAKLARVRTQTAPRASRARALSTASRVSARSARSRMS